MANIIINTNVLADVLERSNITQDANITRHVRELRYAMDGKRAIVDAVEHIAITLQSRLRRETKD